MPAATVRAAVQSFLTGQVPGLAAVYTAQPYYVDGDLFGFTTNGNYGAVAYVHLDRQEETRIAFGGASGGHKQVTYQVGLVVLYKYLILPDSTVDEAAWAGPLDALLDAVVARLRSDRTLGTGAGGVVWQAGEDNNDLRIQRDLPVEDDGVIHSWQVVEFTVVEQVAA